ncbi:LuxR family transcriptional regulator [Paenibacillus glycinis]|uniref:AAA family ATPase n=1 Tax=Paenibacillus glycinis TaxID=2697035 RepID=A0ABW9Y0V6_9BACL|nr:LuxR family transcriptional regulator [Paenibacillus glycinis]NBD28356.1 AAA family ATPase [Paenibacillus glycinis]
MRFETNRMFARERYYIVGRETELEQFEGLLQGGSDRKFDGAAMLHVYGTGGVGKSTFLRLCQHAAEQTGAYFMQLDSRDFVHTEPGVTEALFRKFIDCEAIEERQFLSEKEWKLKDLIEAFRNMPPERGVVLAFDTFEEMQDMETWLRDRLIPWLPEGGIVLTAGRYPLKGSWVQKPAWRERLKQVLINHLDRSDCMDYLQRCGLSDENRMERIWRQTKGHPLTLSLAAARDGKEESHAGVPNQIWFGEIAALWLKEVPNQELRKWVEAASILRHFNLELLEHVMQEKLSPIIFDQLVAFSFVRKSERGWQLHDLMQDSVSELLKERSPRLYKQLRERSASFYAGVLLNRDEGGGGGWEVGELFRYAGVKVVRALTSDASTDSYFWETVTESTLDEAAAYVEWRRNCSDDIVGTDIDPETGEEYLIHYSSEALRINVAGVNVRALFQLEPQSLKLLRDRSGASAALAAIIPFHNNSLEWLKDDPHCGPYLASLSAEARHRLKTPRERPAGWFIKLHDFRNVLDPDQRTVGMQLIYEYMCGGEILVCSPYPSEIARHFYPSIGFTVAQGATHCNYDGVMPTPTYVFDTRGEKLRHFLEDLLCRAGSISGLQFLSKTYVKPSGPANVDNGLSRSGQVIKRMTEREAEVASLVLTGCSNLEIANQLYISEVTVKKHLKSVYAKLNIRTRTQLAALMAASTTDG